MEKVFLKNNFCIIINDNERQLPYCKIRYLINDSKLKKSREAFNIDNTKCCALIKWSLSFELK
jgi:hypothetical protein